MRFIGLVFFFSCFTAVKAQQLIFNEDFNAGIPASWYLVNADELTPAAAVDTFDNAWIPFIYDGDTCAASTSYYLPSGQSADYLITPRISLDATSKLVWSTRSYDASYPDGYLILVSTTDSLVTSFTDTVFVEYDETYYWQTRSVQLDLEGYANEDVFIAFRNYTTDGFILMLDNVKVLSSDFVSMPSEVSVSTDLLISPNPAADHIQISGFMPTQTFVLYDLNGQEILRSTEAEIDVRALSNGLYIYTIFESDARVSSGKLSKL